jgi:hypothetical protein
VNGFPVRLLVGAVFVLAGTAHCRRPPSERDRAAAEGRAAERAAREAPRYLPQPLPIDPPLERVRIENSGLPCDVDDVLARKCRRCHTTPARHNAPFELYTWEDTRQDRFGQPLYVHLGRVVATGFMPYAIEANPPIARLTPEEKKILLDWVAAGAPKTPCEPNETEPKRPVSARRGRRAKENRSPRRARASRRSGV